MTNKELLEETEGILLNAIETVKGMTVENLTESIAFIKKSFTFLTDEILPREVLDNIKDGTIADLLTKVKRNSYSFLMIALSSVNNENYVSKKEILVNWLKFYSDRLEGVLRNG